MKKSYIQVFKLLLGWGIVSIVSGFTLFNNPLPTVNLAAPTVRGDVGSIMKGDPSFSINVLSNDIGNPGIDPTTVDLDVNTAGIQKTYVQSSVGTWTVNNSGVVTFTPLSTFEGLASINYRVSSNDATPVVSGNASIRIAVRSYPSQTNQPSGDPFTHFTDFPRIKLYTWAEQFYSYTYNSTYGSFGRNTAIRFRLKPPKNYNVANTTKYPLILFFHGSGEIGDYWGEVQNNEIQLVHGGQRSLNAVNAVGTSTNPKFDGFLFYPQARQTGQNCGIGVGCSTGWSVWLEQVRNVLDILIQHYHVDPNRIYVHGLSGGGEATWNFAREYPDYIAAMHPMSASGPSFWSENYKHIPIRLSQGGKDTNPPPAFGNGQVNQIRDVYGGNIRYSYYPNSGHDTWNSEYQKSDFFPWFLSQDKTTIHVFKGEKDFCPDNPISATNSVRLGVSKTINVANNPFRIINYQWAKGDTSNIVSSGSATNEYVATSADTYYMRFQRNGIGWSKWSSVTLTNERGPSATPTINSGGKSVNLPSLDGSAEVVLGTSNDKEVYNWLRDGSTSVGSHFNYAASLAGSYTVRVKDKAQSPTLADDVTPSEYRPNTTGCWSNPSAPIIVTTVNGPGVPAPPGSFYGATVSQTSIKLTWQDRSTNETGFEIYRSTNPTTGYQLVTITPSYTGTSVQSFTDTGLATSTVYYYQMRAVNTSGGSAYTPMITVSTVMDDIKPTAPVLIKGSSSRTVINLSWSGASDNVGIVDYLIYQNGNLVGTTTGQSFAVTSVTANTAYYFTVVARDAAGNLSNPSNQLNTAAVNTGLFYRFYTVPSATASTTVIESTGTFVKSGEVANFSLAPRTVNDNFGFIYEGFITIPSAGLYTFFTSSDDGSMLYINDELIVNNDGLHGSQERSGTKTFPAGAYPQVVPIKVTFHEAGGSEVLEVRWQGPGITKQLIPDAALRDDYTPAEGPAQPTVFRYSTTQPSSNPAATQVWLQFTDNSTNETGFEIQRQTQNNSTTNPVESAWRTIATLPANPGTGVVYFTDEGLTPSTRYFYRVRAINNEGGSNYRAFMVNNGTSGNVYFNTQSATPPSAPNPLTVSAASPNVVNLSWSNVANETAYEIEKSPNATVGNYVKIATVGANVTTYTDNAVVGNTTYYYRVRALNGSAPSAYTNVVNIKTPNSVPVITTVTNRSVSINATTDIAIKITDADNDPISVSFTHTGTAPTNVVWESNGYGEGILRVTYGATTGSTQFTITASDGIANATGTNTFTLTVGTSVPPSITGISIGGVAINPVPSYVPPVSVEEGKSTTLVLTANLPSGSTWNSPIHSVSGLPSWAQAVPGGSGQTRTLTFTFNPNIGHAGLYPIEVIFRNNANGILIVPVNLSVTPIDQEFQVYINFNYFPEYNESGVWNNTGGPRDLNSPMINLKDDQQNILKNILFEPTIVAGSWGEGDIGTPSTYTVDLPITANSPFTEKVRESFFRTTTNGNSGNTMRFKNLNSGLKYRVKLFSAGASVPMRLWMVGATTTPTITIPTPNTDQLYMTDYISPKANGELDVLVARQTGYGNGFYYVNALVLEAIYINDQVVPNAPADLAGTAASATRVNLSWNDRGLNENGFRIYRSLSASGPFTAIGTVGRDVTTYQDNTTIGRQVYYYRVVAYNGQGESPVSNTAIVSTPNGAPVLAPIAMQSVNVGSTLQVNFSATDPEGDPISFSLSGSPSFANLVDNQNGTGFISFTPSTNHAGVYTITLRATDNNTATTQTTFMLHVLNTEVEQTVYVSFTGSSTVGAPWNNVLYGSAANVDYATVNSLGISTSIKIRREGNWSGSVDGGNENSGAITGDNTGIYVDDVLRSGWYTTNTNNTGVPIQINGLNPNKRYNITILGSKNEFSIAQTIYRVSTGTPALEKTLKTSMNTQNTITLAGITPNNSGLIKISTRRPDNTIDALTWPNATINAMIIEEYTPSSTPRRPTKLVAQGTGLNTVKLTWQDNSSNETGFEIYRAENPSGPFTLQTTTASNIETWEDTGLVANKAYVYRIRAVNGSFQSDFSETVMTSTFEQIFYLNVGPANIAPLPWNNYITSDLVGGTIFGPLYNQNSVMSSVSVEFVATGNGGVLGSNDKAGYSLAAGIFPIPVQHSYMYWVPNTGRGEFQITGLDPTKTYDLLFYSCDYDFTVSNFKMITNFIVGSEKKTQFNGRNLTETSDFLNIKPDANGVINFQIEAHPEAFASAWNGMVIRQYTPIEAAFDTQAPSIPTGLTSSNVASDSVRLHWNASVDNVGVAGYEVFQGTTLVATVLADTTALVTDLQPNTSYTFTVRAFDLKGNRSGLSSAVTVVTLAGAAQTAYYTKPTGDLNLTSSWGTNPDGSGSAPANFTSPNRNYIVTRNATLNNALTISGNNTNLTVANGVTLTVNSPLTANINTEGNAIVDIHAAAAPTLGTLSEGSTIRFSNSTNAIPGASYGNLELTGNGTTKTFGTGRYTIQGDFIITDDVVIAGGENNSTVLNITGDLIINGNPTLPSASELFAVEFNGAIHTLSGKSSALQFANLQVGNGSTVMVQNTDITGKTLTVGSATGGGISIANEGVLALGNTDLVITGQGSINENNETGKIRVSKGALLFNTIGEQTSNLYFENGQDTVRQLVLNMQGSSQVNVRSKMYVREDVSVNTGHLNSGGFVSLVSDAEGTARIAPIGGASSIIGGIQFQRYYDISGRVYRYVSTPILNTTVANWNSQLQITGPFVGGTGSSSLWYYNEPSGGYVAFPGSGQNTSLTFTLGRGYSLYMYGGLNAQKLLFDGLIQQGNFTFPTLTGSTSAETGWNLMGNPYASPIQWGQTGWTRTQLSPTVYIRENDNPGTGLVTKVKWYDAELGIGGTNGSLNQDLGISFDGVIAAGQAFWVKATGTTPALAATENVKATSNNAAFYRTASGPRNVLRIRMDNNVMFDESVVHFNETATAGIDEHGDAIKLDNSFFNVSTIASDNKLVLNSLPANYCSTVVKLSVNPTTNGTYALSFGELESFDYPLTLVLRDKYLNKEVTISSNEKYSFSTTADENSKGSNRFEILLAKPEISTLTAFQQTNMALCNEASAITLTNTQYGARYEILYGDIVVSEKVGSANTTTLSLDPTLLANGVQNLHLRASYDGCAKTTLETVLTVENTLPPVATLIDGVLVSSQESGNQWYFNGKEIPGAVGVTYIPKDEGEYSVSTQNGSCRLSSENVIYAITGSEREVQEDFVLFPNPVEGKFTIKLPATVRENKRAQISIIANNGSEVMKVTKVNKREGIELQGDGLISGLYTIQVQVDGQTLQRKLVRK